VEVRLPNKLISTTETIPTKQNKIQIRPKPITIGFVTLGELSFVMILPYVEKMARKV
jgi:hypothetical protein